MGKNVKVLQASCGRILACSITALLLAAESATLAQEGVWIGPESGNWSVPTNWQSGVVPISDPALTLRFIPSGSVPITGTNDLPETFSAGTLHFESTSKGLFTLAGNALRLTGAASTIVQGGIGSAAISAPLVLDLAPGGAVTIGGNGLGDLTLSGAITETGGPASLVIAGQTPSLNTQLISLLGANNTTGGITLGSGNLVLGSSAMGAGNAPLVVKGGSLRFAGNASFTNPIILHSDLLLVGWNAVSLGPISSAVAGTGLTVRGGGSLTLAEPSAYTGATRIAFDPTATVGFQAAQLVLTGAGALTATSLIDVRSGGTVMIDGTSAGGALDRIPDASPIELRSGRLALRATIGSPTPQVEHVGALKVAGHSIVTVDVSADTTIAGQIVAASLERVGQGTLLLRGIPTGPAPSAANSRGRILLTSPPSDMIGSGTGVMTPIVPYAIGDSSTALGSIGSGLVTYTPDIGFRLLQINEYASNFSTPGSNVRLTRATTNDVDRTINSLVLDGGSLTGSGTLTISSGVVLHRGGQIFQKLEFGSRDGRIFTASNLTLFGQISGSGGLTAAGGTLTLKGNNTFSGPLTINSGEISFDLPSQLGDPGSPLVFDGPNVRLHYSGLGDQTLEKNIIVESGMARFGYDFFFRETLELSGRISGPGGLELGSDPQGVSGRGTVRLTGENTFTGPIVVRGATLEIDSDAALGLGGELTAINGELRLLGPWVTNRVVRIEGGFERLTIDTQGFDARLSGPVLGGRLIKKGQGTLTLESPKILPESVVIEEGTFALAEGARSGTTSFLIPGGTKLHSDQTAPGSVSHLSPDAELVFIGGEFAITGRSGEMAVERIRELRASYNLSTVSLSPGAGVDSGASLSVGSLAQTGGLLIRADDLGGSNNRFTVGGSVSVQSGVAMSVYTQNLSGGPELLTIYESVSDAKGVIGFRPAQMIGTATIQNPVNGGLIPESANVHVTAADAAAVGARNTINSLTLAPRSVVSLAADQVLRLESGSLLRQSGAGIASITGGSLDPGDASATLATFGDLEISSALVGSSSLTKIGGGTLTISGPISLTGGITAGAGTLRLTSANTYTGATVVYGALEIGDDAALGGNMLEFAGAGASLHLDGPWNTSRRVVFKAGSSNLYLHGNDAILDGPLEGLGDLTTHGPGVVTLTSDSPHAGRITLRSDLRLSGMGATRSYGIIASAGSLTLDNRAVALSDRLLDTVSINGPSAFTLIGNELVAVSEKIGTLSPSSSRMQAVVRLVAPGEQPTILDAASFSIFSSLETIAGDRLGGGVGGFTRLTFRTVPSLSNGLLSGTLVAESSDGIPDSFATYDIATDQYGPIGVRALRESEYLSSGTILNTTPSSANFLATSEVTLGPTNATINTLTMRGNGAISLTPGQKLYIWSGDALVQSGAEGVIRGGDLEARRFLVNGSLDLESALSTSSFAKYGLGTMRLGSANISNSMSIYEGTLVLGGTVSNNGAPLVAPLTTAVGATLGGNGEIVGGVSISGTLSPGEGGVGVIKTHNLALNANSALSLEIASVKAFDRLEVAGTLTLNGPVNLALSLSFDPDDGVDTFTLIANDGNDPVALLSGGHFVFGNQPLSEGTHFLADGQYFQISYAGGDGNDVVLRAVPEPSSALLMLSGLVGFLNRRRRPAQRNS